MMQARRRDGRWTVRPLCYSWVYERRWRTRKAEDRRMLHAAACMPMADTAERCDKTLGQILWVEEFAGRAPDSCSVGLNRCAYEPSGRKPKNEGSVLVMYVRVRDEVQKEKSGTVGRTLSAVPDLHGSWRDPLPQPYPVPPVSVLVLQTIGLIPKPSGSSGSRLRVLVPSHGVNNTNPTELALEQSG